ncbi:hypothetical protein DHEL01_v203283 [Diaporthe helianthi]|uniref:Uncharacterized protein n=1 Tax=Diaporthe helianthi TaxID=158607 RepID=A0A2P5I721_DIAHE|nr:hypothetical protein DHEL01_v203283 [Diaporthe helianthi]
MFSPSALGSSICLRCQTRAVTGRAPPLLAAAAVRGRRRLYASDATNPRPEDVPPAFEIGEHGHETEQRPEEPQRSQPDEPSPSMILEQPLTNPPQDSPRNAVGLPDRSTTDGNNLDGIGRHTRRDENSRADLDLTENALTSEPEPEHRTQDRTDAWKTKQIDDLLVGLPQLDSDSTTASALADRTSPPFRKTFSSPARRDEHTSQGHVLLKPPRALKCSKCGGIFGTKKLLHRHLARTSCSGRAKSQELAGKEGGQNVEDILTRAAAGFSRSQSIARAKFATADDWDLPRREDVRLQVTPADREPSKPTREGAAAGVEDNTQTEPEMRDEKADTMGNSAIIQEGLVKGRDMGHDERSKEGSPVVLIRRLGKVDHSTRIRKKQHRRGDVMLVEDASELGIESLGRPAEVIVLREGRQRERTRPVAAISEELTDDSLKIEDWLEQQEILSPDEVMKNIHGLKPERRIVSAREYKSLFNTLFDGFTISQLGKYVVWHREQPILETIKDEVFGEDNAISEEPAIPAGMPPKHRDYAWMTDEAHWTPHVDGAVEEAHYPLAGYIMKSMPPKQRLVVQLLRECWDISIQELLDGNGRIDIRLRDMEFKLLTLGAQSWLRHLSRRFLEDGQQIEVRRSKNLIRITAPKTVAETCINRLDDTLQKTKTRPLDLDHIPVRHLDAATLEELGRITNSVVHFGPGRKTINVTWIDLWDQEAQSTFENPADKVFRLILTASPPARTWNNVSVYPDVEGNGKLVQGHNINEKLPWTDRRSEWARICLPLTSKQQRAAKACPLTTDVLRFRVQPTEEDLALPYSTYQRKVDRFDERVSPLGLPRTKEEESEDQIPAQEPETTDATPSGWRPFKITTSAAFGHVLQLSAPKLAENIARPHMSATLANWPRTFAPLIPHVAEMTLPAWSPYDDGIYKGRALTILMRFAPFSEDAKSSIYTERAPPLELRLTGDDLEIKGVHSLRAINRTSISDILLPEEHVDIRTTQQEYAELSPDNINSTGPMEPLYEFLNKSRFDLRNGKLKTPPRLHNLGLPRWLLAPPLDIAATEPTSKADAKRKKKAAATQPPQNLSHTPEGNQIRNVSYVFAGLEFRYAAETTYEGWKLVYTSIEAGAGGGRRAELSLEAVPGYDKDLRRTKEAINPTFFLRSIYQLATGQRGHLVPRAGGEEQVRTSISWVR